MTGQQIYPLTSQKILNFLTFTGGALYCALDANKDIWKYCFMESLNWKKLQA